MEQKQKQQKPLLNDEYDLLTPELIAALHTLVRLDNDYSFARRLQRHNGADSVALDNALEVIARAVGVKRLYLGDSL